MLWLIGGAKRGGGQITHAPLARYVLLPIETVAVTGPSETSSCQPSLLANVVRGAPVGEAELPKPPSTRSRPALSVWISPRGTGVPRNWPVSNTALLLGPMVRGPGVILSELRSVTEAFRSGPVWPTPWNWLKADFVLASSTVQVIFADAVVISPMKTPSS